MTAQKIEEQLNEINQAIQMGASGIDEINEKLSIMITYTGLSSEVLRHAKSLVLHKQKSVIESNMDRGISASILKQLVEGELWFEIGLLTYAERINSALSHCISGLVTQVSLYKEELKNSMRDANNQSKTF